MKLRDYTPMAPPLWTDEYRVKAFAACLLYSNNPPMPHDVRLARAMQHAFLSGVMVGQAQMERKLQKQKGPR
jgi:hypothetical protein